jgi:hypothetical protein
MPTAPKFRLTWFLIKSGVDTNDVDQIIEPPKGGTLHRYRVPVLDAHRELLFVKASAPHPPKWLRYVSGHIGAEQLPACSAAQARECCSCLRGSACSR